MSAPDWLTRRPIAHRGLHDRSRGVIENSLSAARAAIAGDFAIECDVQLTADGEPVVFHDFDLGRLTSATGAVRTRAAAELAELRLVGTSDTIPTLIRFLDAIGGMVPLVVEIKSDFSGGERLARRTAEIVAGRSERIALKSFDPAIVRLVRELAPSVPRGIVGQSSYGAEEAKRIGPARLPVMTELLHWADTRPDFVSWRQTDLPAAGPNLARLLAGAPVMTWTVRSEADRSRVGPYTDQIVFEGFVPA